MIQGMARHFKRYGMPTIPIRMPIRNGPTLCHRARLPGDRLPHRLVPDRLDLSQRRLRLHVLAQPAQRIGERAGVAPGTHAAIPSSFAAEASARPSRIRISVRSALAFFATYEALRSESFHEKPRAPDRSSRSIRGGSGHHCNFT